MRLPTIPGPSLELQTAMGALLGAIAVLSTVLAVQDVARLPLTILAAATGLTFVWIFVSVARKQRQVIAELRRQLDASDQHELALLELNQRIIEGNELARKLKHYRPAEPVTTAWLDEEKDGFAQMVREWNRDCWETAHAVLPHMAGSLDAPIPPRIERPVPAGPIRLRGIYWQENLLHEVTVKIERLQGIQAKMDR